ncbi:hypothetical protein BX666DRAFT_2125517 [Dichotomocladium elegans]|nr:hypothetical protein BX666DRAFT_2125517 [Dichotomocladium elegans]
MSFISFMSEWQLKLLKEDGDLACLDSTHKTCVDGTQKDCYLYTLLKWLKVEHEYVLSRVMIDDSDTEIVAINKAHNAMNEEISPATYTNNEKKEMREQALSLMMSMTNAETPDDFGLMHEEFEVWCIDNDDERENTVLYMYFECEFLRKRENGAKYGAMDDKSESAMSVKDEMLDQWSVQ